MDIQAYIDVVRAKHASGVATEHSYRPALEALLASAADGIEAINEPRRVACGAPDFVVVRGGIDVGHCEAKDLPVNLGKLKDANLDQKKRYLKALPNLIYTNGIDFEFYRNGDKIRSVSIGALAGGKIAAMPEHFLVLEHQLRAFAAERPQTITTAKQLARMMAGKAVLIKDIMGNALRADAHRRTALTDQYLAFRTHLIHDIDPGEFADIYAETIAYGLFAARLHDTTPDTFNRREALDLLPKSNPFLRSLFSYIAGVDLDDRIAWVIDELCDVLRACDVHALMADFGRWTARNDPFLHFYETFLAEYNPAKRKARGVWYTPEPVVNFIVRAVDDVLKAEFGLPLGLADTSKITVDWDTGQTDAKGNRTTIRKDVHRVQILDPATGTGTFLAEAIKQIAAKVQGVAPGLWSKYVEDDLIPRIHGFELLMASYAMCHMKIDMMLAGLGYVPSASPPRLSVYLTNSLEEGDVADQQLPFARWLSEEARGANTIKRDTPIMCVIGNPPYSVSSSNRGDWIERLTSSYKRDLGERNIQPLSDDYVKFIRLAQHFVEKNGQGIVGYITNNSYIDGVIHRRMRRELVSTFDKIYIIDLHGNTNKGEISPDGTIDENVFDIKQGVALIILVKTGKLQTSSTVFKSERFGYRSSKNTWLWSNTLKDPSLKPIVILEPYNLFLPFGKKFNEYDQKGFVIRDLMTENLSGVVSGSDARFVRFKGNEDEIDNDRRKKFLYRPLDYRFIDYDPKQLQRARIEIMQHMILGDNIAMIAPRQAYEGGGATVSSALIGHKTFSAYNRNYVFPLYLYPEPGSLDTDRRVNFDPAIYAAIRAAAGLADPSLAAGAEEPPTELRVFDYIYGVLHSPAYRRTYAQFLKIDFPRIPYPASPEVFAHVAGKGGELRRLHLMDDAAIGATPYPLIGHGDGTVDKVERVAGRVHINAVQSFDAVPDVAWTFPIGGYQPAQKWLKDRKGRTLGFDDIRHYQKIVRILVETDRIMREIELPLP